jgi:hypothetical protein
MSEPAEERYVVFEWSCECGAKLQVHGEYYVGFRAGEGIVQCPKCGKPRSLPTRALRVFLREGEILVPVEQLA